MDAGDLAWKAAGPIFRSSWVGLSIVMPGLVPGIHVFPAVTKTWMAGTSPAMTVNLIGK